MRGASTSLSTTIANTPCWMHCWYISIAKPRRPFTSTMRSPALTARPGCSKFHSPNKPSSRISSRRRVRPSTGSTPMPSEESGRLCSDTANSTVWAGATALAAARPTTWVSSGGPSPSAARSPPADATDARPLLTGVCLPNNEALEILPKKLKRLAPPTALASRAPCSASFPLPAPEQRARLPTARCWASGSLNVVDGANPNALLLVSVSSK
mmetsp:Transcript_147760/g.472863  ORF Transcript_147760/g.472863 Transcript_147760/m.472863 type:complete len:212 (+) Transcript_147760:774-1409(+)